MTRTGRRSFGVWLPLVPIAAGAVLFVVLAARNSDGGEDDSGSPAELHSDAPAYQSLGALVAASDVIVVGDVVDVTQGRRITAPETPEAAFVTQYVELRVDAVLRGEAGATVVVEEIVSLGDGTPVEVDGQPASSTGERLLLFLRDGATDGAESADERTAFAAVNGQGRYELSPSNEIVGPAALLPVDWTVDELVQVAEACLDLDTC